LRTSPRRSRRRSPSLAKKIKEKESVVKKLEQEELNPDNNLVRKIRNALGLELLVAGETPAVPATARPVTGRTLGDIMKLSQTKEKEEKG